MLPVQPRSKKYSASTLGQITAITPPIHPGKRGVSRSSRTRGWMRWTQRRRARSWSQGGFSRERSYVSADDRRFKALSSTSHRQLAGCVAGEGAAYGEVVWSWHPMLMSKPAEMRRPDRAQTSLNPLATVAKRKFVAGESTYKP